jgi:hypothetical protein
LKENIMQQQQRHTHRWILATAFGLGLTAAVPLATQAQPAPRAERRADRTGTEVVVPIDLNGIPGPARDKIEEVARRAKIAATYKVHRNGQDVYRATIQRGDHGDRIVLVSRDGNLINVEDVRGPELAAYRQNPDAWYRDYDDRMLAQEQYLARQVEVVRGTPQHPEQISLDEVPGAARATLIREAYGDRSRLSNTIRYKDNQGNVIYQCNIPDDPNRPKSVHMVQVLPDGRIFNEGDFSNRGERLDDWRPKTMGYDDLPGRVKETVDREAPRGRVPHVDVARRGGQNIYTVQVEDRDRTRYLTLNEDGKVLSDVSQRYDSASGSDRNRDRAGDRRG